MVIDNSLKIEINTWLGVILKKQNLKNLSVQISGKAENGEGYTGDIVFAQASGTAANESTQEYDLVLKCSKRSRTLREDKRFTDSFINEMYVYDELFPMLIQFQQDITGVDKVFNNVPKCYGTLAGDNTELIVLENLKSIGYEIWPRKEPLTRKHIDLVMQAYGKFHAVSVALRQQEPNKYKEIASTLRQNLKSFIKNSSGMNTMKSCVEYAYEVLRDALDETLLLKWKSLGDNIETILEEVQSEEAMNVIIHGDCWSNNFMYKYDSEDKLTPTEVVVLDWQMARPSSLICDLSYFLFCCISEKDINSMEDVLKVYYQHFSNYLAKLGIDSITLYPLGKFLDEWKKYCKFGLIVASMLLRMTSVNKEDVVDVVEAAEKGKGYGESFLNEIKDKVVFKKRIQYIVEYAVKHDLI